MSKNNFKKYKNKEWLEEQYIKLQKPFRKICKEFNISEPMLNKLFLEFNIPKRTFSECAQLRTNNGNRLYRDKEWLEEQYVINKKSCGSIAKELNCDPTIIPAWLRKFNIHVRTNSEAHIGLLFGDPNSSKRLAARARMSGDNHPMKRPEIRAKVSGSRNGMNQPGVREKHLAAVNTPECKAIKSFRSKESWKNNPEMRINHSKRFTGPNNPNYGKPPAIGTQWSKGEWYLFKDGSKIWIRSPYEMRVIYALDKLNIKWKYESKSFEVGELGTWRPDFYLPDYDIWWEIKGHLFPESKEKIIKFCELYPDENLRILYLDDILELECYKHNNWKFDVFSMGYTL